MSVRKRDRKRRRSIAFAGETAAKDATTESLNEQLAAIGNGGPDAQVAINGTGVDTADDPDAEASPERLAKEQAVWETFREEHYEGALQPCFW